MLSVTLHPAYWFQCPACYSREFVESVAEVVTCHKCRVDYKVELEGE